MLPLISIIIPYYNQPKSLRLALASIKKQTYENLEIIIVDDGSAENFKFQISNFKLDIPIQIVFQENKGAPSARNRGLELAKGEYVIFWDADVVAVPNMLEIMKKTLDNNPAVSFVYCDYNLQLPIFNLSRQSTGSRILSGQKIFKSQIFNLQKLRENNYIHSTSLIRRIDAIKWDESLKRFQDWDLWLTLVEQNKKGIYLPGVLFEIVGQGTMSVWLPSFAYKKPWSYLPGIRNKVENFNKAKEIILKKHNLN